MIYSVSTLQKHPTIEDFYCIFINRQEPEINNNTKYTQKVMGSKKAIKEYRKNILKQMQVNKER